MTIDELLAAYVTLTLALLAVIAWYYARRQKHFGPIPSADRIFRCEKCGCVYTDDPDVDRSRCSQCGTLNEAIQF